MTGLLLIHGRSQQMRADLRSDQPQVDAYIAAKKRSWMAGLAKGLTLAGRPPVALEDAEFPFYGNHLADMIETHERAGGQTPNLESSSIASKANRSTDALILESADRLGFTPEKSLARTDPELADEVSGIRGNASAAEAGWSDALKPRIVREALQLLSDKTGTPAWIIETFLRDVAYYLEDQNIRDEVLQIVRSEFDKLASRGEVIVIGHSLGSVVAYDLLQGFDPKEPVALMVTAGSPLGLRIVQNNLRGRGSGNLPPVPSIRSHSKLAWLNAYDVQDVVALVHPLADRFSGTKGQLRDERTFNPSGPHSITDYLSDPDVAEPIGAAIAASTGGRGISPAD